MDLSFLCGRKFQNLFSSCYGALQSIIVELCCAKSLVWLDFFEVYIERQLALKKFELLICLTHLYVIHMNHFLCWKSLTLCPYEVYAPEEPLAVYLHLFVDFSQAFCFLRDFGYKYSSHQFLMLKQFGRLFIG